MAELKKLHIAKEMLDTAERSLKSAQTILSELLGNGGKEDRSEESSLAKNTPLTDAETEKVIEGVFDGEKMLGPDGRAYPVPHNYASKSKLIPGDLLKLTITKDGRFIYKNIGPIDRRTTIGTLTYEDGIYKVIAEGKTFKVLTASVTFFKAQPGDQLAIIIPSHHESSWAAVEALITQPAEAPLSDKPLEDVAENSVESLSAVTEAKPAIKKESTKKASAKKVEKKLKEDIYEAEEK